MKSLAEAIYRAIFAKGIFLSAVRFFISSKRWEERFRLDQKASLSNVSPIWFHAASVGELESLSPLILSIAEGNRSSLGTMNPSKREYPSLILTVLSESAEKSLERLKKVLLQKGVQILYCGYSPLEGQWEQALLAYQPCLFVSSKYEAWPELWVSLKKHQIPLAMISIHARKSLRIARWVCRFLTGGVPELYLFPCTQSEVRGLKELFPQSQIEVVGEPRWDQVAARLKRGSERARELIEICGGYNHPWGILGSVWTEDLDFLKDFLIQAQGTLWMVPHKVDDKSIDASKSKLEALGFQPLLSSDLRKGVPLLPHHTLPPNCLLVNEMGFLSELYAVADWAFVGGGFGQGIHSTIEPAIHGIPIAVGPNGTGKFYEVAELTRSGQLHILRTQEDLSEWGSVLKNVGEGQKAEWKRMNHSQLGATEKILSSLEKFILR